VRAHNPARRPRQPAHPGSRPHRRGFENGARCAKEPPPARNPSGCSILRMKKPTSAAVPFHRRGRQHRADSTRLITRRRRSASRVPRPGAQVYYLNRRDRRREAVPLRGAPRALSATSRFPAPAETEVIGAGLQQLCYPRRRQRRPDFPAALRSSSAPGLRFALWGYSRGPNNLAQPPNPVFSGLAGVLPAKYVAETVKAMGAVQDKALRGVKKARLTCKV